MGTAPGLSKKYSFALSLPQLLRLLLSYRSVLIIIISQTTTGKMVIVLLLKGLAKIMHFTIKK